MKPNFHCLSGALFICLAYLLLVDLPLFLARTVFQDGFCFSGKAAWCLYWGKGVTSPVDLRALPKSVASCSMISPALCRDVKYVLGCVYYWSDQALLACLVPLTERNDYWVYRDKGAFLDGAFTVARSFLPACSNTTVSLCLLVGKGILKISSKQKCFKSWICSL